MLIRFITKIFSKFFIFTGLMTRKNEFKTRLSKEKEQELLERIHNAKLANTSDPEAENLIITHNLRLVAHISKKYRSAYSDPDDIVSVGSIGLIKATRTFDASKAKNFSTYASRCIENEILMLLRSEKKYSSEISIEEKLGTDKDGNDITFKEILHDVNYDLLEIAEYNNGKKILETSAKKILDQRELKIVSLRYGLFDETPKTQTEVAKILGISRSYISRIEKNSVKKLTSFIKNNF